MKALSGNLIYEHRMAGIPDIAQPWRGEFEAEVADNNFLRGGKCMLLCGAGAEVSLRQWGACLMRGGYKVYRITPLEIVRRVNAQPVLCDNDTRKDEFDAAECFLIDDLFFNHTFAEGDAYRLWWFMQEMVRDGAVLVAANETDTVEIPDCYPDYLGAFVEETFEVIRGNKSEVKKASGIKKRGPSNR